MLIVNIYAAPTKVNEQIYTRYCTKMFVNATTILFNIKNLRAANFCPTQPEVSSIV